MKEVKGFEKISYFIHYKITRNILSQLMNFKYWIFNIKELSKAIKTKKETFKNIKNLDDVREFMSKYDWTKEDIDWKPWVITVLHKDLKDDCDGAANLGKALLVNIGVPASIYHLKNNSGHAIAVSKNKKFIISNNNLVKIKKIKLETFLDNYFDGKYKKFYKE